MREIEETSITIDHDLGRVWIDTRNQAFAGMCKRAGLVADAIRPREVGGYVRFRCTISDVDVIVRRHRMARPPSPEATAAGLEAIRAARAGAGARQK